MEGVIYHDRVKMTKYDMGELTISLRETRGQFDDVGVVSEKVDCRGEETSNERNDLWF